MPNVRTAVALALLTLLSGCASLPPTQDIDSATPFPAEHERSLTHELIESGRYHEAMQHLPLAMEEWRFDLNEYGSVEGADGLQYYRTMEAIAGKGDADWGAILDDPGIPYNYKIDLIAEIVEARMGKDTVKGHDDGYLLPRQSSINNQ